MSDFDNIDLYWIREDERQDQIDQQQENESDEIACWLDSASAREVNRVWWDLDIDADKHTDTFVEMVLNGEDAKAWLRHLLQDIAEKNYPEWKKLSVAAYKERS
jgi:phage terminase large subunit-like protein